MGRQNSIPPLAQSPVRCMQAGWGKIFESYVLMFYICTYKAFKYGH